MNESPARIHRLPARGRPPSPRPSGISSSDIENICNLAEIDAESRKEVRINIMVPEWLRVMITQLAAQGRTSTKGLILDMLERGGIPTTEASLRERYPR